MWDYGQYLLGLEKLGFEVFYLEDTGMLAYDPVTKTYGEDSSYSLDFLVSSLIKLMPALEKRWHFRSSNGRAFGLDEHVLHKILRNAAVFINVSGSAVLRDEYLASPRKVLVDTDPGYNHFVNYPKWDRSQAWLGTHGYRAHDFFFTYAEKMGQSDCKLPSLGISWRTTRPLVSLES